MTRALRRRWCRSGVRRAPHLLLVVAFGIALLLQFFDPEAIERNPYHDHLVLGASGSDVASTLEAHHHGHDRPHNRSSAPLPASENPPDVGESRVVSVTGALGIISVWSFLTAAKVLPRIDGLVSLLPSLPGPRLSSLVHPLTGIALPTPKPPPRSSS